MSNDFFSGSSEHIWSIPMNLTITSSNGVIGRFRHLLTSATEVVTIPWNPVSSSLSCVDNEAQKGDAPFRLNFNADSTGFYRVHYLVEETSLRRMIKDFQEPNEEKKSEFSANLDLSLRLSRFNFMNDGFALVNTISFLFSFRLKRWMDGIRKLVSLKKTIGS
ncbi:unnamed protein product [Protopolystoma xenopodis]|uniref:Uncharacterized protein n=1 Tax=Protopolystoma xenopodis TaxID=117903 RepID=A0A3S5BX00_9PLAT|nr:unnamed protein product [Protopolystoma xenopodis]